MHFAGKPQHLLSYSYNDIAKKFLVVLFSLFSISGIAQNEKYKPIILDSGAVVIFSPDLRLKVGIEGSIEIQASFKPISSVKNSIYSIVKNGKDHHQQYKISIRSDMKTIYFSNNTGIASWRISFTDTTLFHQLVFITHRNRTDFYCDGKKMPLNSKSSAITYAPSYDFKNELQLGDESNEDIQCKFRTLRLWNALLPASVLPETALNYGAPREGNSSDDSLYNSLIGYSFFTPETESFFYTNPGISATAYAGVQHGNYYVFTNDGTRDKSPAEIAALMIINKDSGVGPILPVITKTKLKSLNDSSLSYTQVPSKLMNKVKSIDTANYPVLSGRLKDFTKNSSMPSNIRVDNTLMKHKNIRRMFGTYNGSHIVSLSFVTTANDTLKISPSATLGYGYHETFCIDIPRYADFRGLIVRQDSLSLNSIAMLYSVDVYNVDDFTLLNRVNASGRWYGQGQKQPQRTDVYDSSNFNNVHGNYSTPPVYSIKDMIQDSTYLVYIDSGTAATNNYLKINKTQLATFKKQSRFSASDSIQLTNFIDSGWHYFNGNATVHANTNGLAINRDSLTIFKLPSQLVRSTVRSSVFPDKIAWGGTFSQDQRPAMSKANFVGYNILKMDPRDFQKDVYSTKEIFTYPKEGSYDYYSTDNRTIVPSGLFYRNDNVGIEKMKSSTVDSSSGYSSSWGLQLGINVGVPEVFSFSENFKYQSEVKQSFQKKQSKTIARTVIGKYALVLDKATMPLSNEFRLAVNKLRNDYVNGYLPDYWGFMDQFGTHYAYAVTYGGMAYLEITHTETDTAASHSNSLKIEAKAEGVIEGLSLGGSAGYSQAFTSDSNRVSNIENVKFGTFGGSMSSGQAWSLQKGEEVPILMDLRPLWDLFSPTFFEDPIVWTTLRKGLNLALFQSPPKPISLTCPSWDCQLTIDPISGGGSNISFPRYLYYVYQGRQISLQIAKDTKSTVTIPAGSFGWFTCITSAGNPVKPFYINIECLPKQLEICVNMIGENTICSNNNTKQ